MYNREVYLKRLVDSIISQKEFVDTDDAEIVISDNGPEHVDLTQAQQQKKGIGINSTKKRLEALCEGSLSIGSDSQGTKATIMIPEGGTLMTKS